MNHAITLFSILLLSAGLAPAHAQSVTILHGSQDAQSCSMEARLASRRQPVGSTYSTYSPSSCSRALSTPNVYSLRDLAALYMNRGIIYVSQEEYQTAFADYKKAFEIAPNLPETYVNLGNLYFLGENFGKAIEFYDRSLELGINQDHIVYLNRGMANEKSGNPDLAENDFNQALVAMPGWQPAQEKLDRLIAKKDSTGNQ